MCSVHGDDLTTTGPKRSLDWFKSELEKRYELTEIARLGPGKEDAKEGRILNRVVHWTPHGIQYEADPRQGEKLLRDLKLDGSKSVGTPGVKDTMEQILSDKPLPREKTTPYRAVTARANYLAADRPDMQFASKEICRWMSSPTERSLVAVKRLGRFLEGHPRLIYSYPWQSATKIDAYSDTDWAGCQKTRKSTSGGCLMLGSHLIKSWSSTQQSVALSSGEAEFYGVVKAAGIALGYRSLMEDLGVQLEVRVWTDSTATIGICGRQGLGKLRHIDTQSLWIQQRVRDSTIELRKVRGEINPADLFTKHLTGNQKIRGLLKLFGCEYVSGRASTAPKLREGVGTQPGELLLAQEELHQHTVEHDGHRYPAIEFEGRYLPDAYEHDPSLLPHFHCDIERLFPRAIAAEPQDDQDVEQNDDLERKGEELGRSGTTLGVRSVTKR